MAKKRQPHYVFEVDGKDLPFGGSRAAALEYVNDNPEATVDDVVAVVEGIFGPYNNQGASATGMVKRVRGLYEKICDAGLREHIKSFDEERWQQVAAERAGGGEAPVAKKPAKKEKKVAPPAPTPRKSGKGMAMEQGLTGCGQMSTEKLDTIWSGRPSELQCLSNALHGIEVTKEQRKRIKSEMDGRPLRDLDQVIKEELEGYGGKPEVEQSEEPAPKPKKGDKGPLLILAKLTGENEKGARRFLRNEGFVEDAGREGFVKDGDLTMIGHYRSNGCNGVAFSLVKGLPPTDAEPADMPEQNAKEPKKAAPAKPKKPAPKKDAPKPAKEKPAKPAKDKPAKPAPAPAEEPSDGEEDDSPLEVDQSGVLDLDKARAARAEKADRRPTKRARPG